MAEAGAQGATPVPTPAECVAARAAATSDLKFSLNSFKVPQDIADRLFFNGVVDTRIFAGIAKSADDLRSVMERDFGVDGTAGFSQRVTMAKILAAWEAAQVHCKKIAETHADQEMRLEPKLLPSSEIQGMRLAFQAKYWKLETREVPSRQYLERLRDQMEKNEFVVEKLSEVTDRESVDPDSAKVTFTPGGDLRSVKAKSERPLPKNSEELRSRVVLMGTAWIMVSLAQGHSHVLADVTPQLWQDYLKYLLGEKVAQLGFRDSNSGNMIGTPPSWRLLLSYELEIRRKALEDVAEGMPFGLALKSAWKDAETKQVYFTTPLGLELATKKQGGGGGGGANLFPPAIPGMPPQPALEEKPTLSKNAQKRQRQEAARKRDEAAAADKRRKEQPPARKSHVKTPDNKPLCFAYNNAKGCKKEGCRFVHACRYCFSEQHSMLKCDKH